jgi:hypothetical protein
MLLKVPISNEAYFSIREADRQREILQRVRSEWSKEIGKAVELARVHVDILAAVCAAESQGIQSAVSKAGAVGLMQIKPATASDCLWYENNRRRMSLAEQDYWATRIPEEWKRILEMKHMGHKLPSNKNTGVCISKETLLNSELNMVIGATFLGQLLDQETDKRTGAISIARVLWRYNQGYFSRPSGKSPQEVLSYARGKSPEAYKYILKIAGKNGLLSMG